MSLMKRSMHLKAQQILNLFPSSFSLTFFKGIIMVIQLNSVFENMQKHKPIWSAYNWKQAGLLRIPSGFKWSIHERDYGLFNESFEYIWAFQTYLQCWQASKMHQTYDSILNARYLPDWFCLWKRIWDASDYMSLLTSWLQTYTWHLTYTSTICHTLQDKFSWIFRKFT